MANDTMRAAVMSSAFLSREDRKAYLAAMQSEQRRADAKRQAAQRQSKESAQ